MFEEFFYCLIFLLIPYGHSDCKVTNNSSIHLWHINDSNRTAPIFLFGTIHLPWDVVWPHVHVSTRAAFDASNIVLLELALNDRFLQQSLQKCRRLPKGVRLESLIGKDLFQKVKKFMDKKKANLTAAVINEGGFGNHAQVLLNFKQAIRNWHRQKPVWLLFNLFQIVSMDGQKRSEAISLDHYLANEAEANGKLVYSLENAQEQCDPLSNLDIEDLLFAIEYTVDYLMNNDKSYESTPKDTLFERYKCGELDASMFDSTQFLDVSSDNSVVSDTIQEKIKTLMFEVRNQRMARRMYSHFEENKDKIIFVAVGAGHFMGKNNIFEALQFYKNYEISPIRSNEVFDAAYINSKNFEPNFKTFRNLWERDNGIMRNNKEKFIAWTDEYPNEIFDNSSAYTFPLSLVNLIAIIIFIVVDL